MTSLQLAPWLYSPIAHGGLLVAALALVLWSYHRQRRAGPRRWALAALRVLAVAGIALLLADPHEEHRTSERARPGLAVLVDASRTVPELDRERFDVQEIAAADGALGDALDALLRHGVDDETRGVLLVSDGRVAGGRDPLAVARRFGAAGVPIHVLAPEPGRAPSLALVGVDGPDAVFLDDVLALRAHLRHTGPVGSRASVALFRDGEPRERRDVTLDGRIATVLFETDAPRPGLFTYELRAALVDGSSAASPSVRARTVRVLDDPLRVLFVQDQPSWEWRFLREALVRDPQVRRGFRTHLVTAAPQVAIAENEYLRDLPESVEELSDFDVVVLGDVAIDQLPVRFQLALRELVAEHGGGLLFLAGRRHDPRALRGTPLEELLPVRLSDEGAGYVDGDSIAVPSARGAEHRALRLDPDGAASARIWSELPALRSTYEVDGARQLATVLLQDEADPSRPLLVGRRFGAGQVAFAATDSTWRWRSQDEGAHYERYWGQLVRWLAIRRRGASAATGRLEPHAEEVAAGSAVHLVATLPDDVELAGELECRIRVGDEAPRLEVLRRRAGGEPVFEGRVVPEQAGVHTAWLGDRERPIAWASFVVRPPLDPNASRVADRELLAGIAQASGGRFLEPRQLASLADALGAQEVERSRVVRASPPRAWTWALLLVIVALLSAEWIGRKLVGSK